MKILLPLFALLLASCATEELPAVQPISFASETPIRLDVARVEVVDEYTPPLKLPNVEHAAPTPPYKAVRIWAGQRLQAAGNSGVVRVTIKDARIVQHKTGDQVTYNGRITAVIDAVSGDRLQTGTATVTVTRALTTDGDKSLSEQAALWDTMTRGMMADFDARATRAIPAHLAAFLMDEMGDPEPDEDEDQGSE